MVNLASDRSDKLNMRKIYAITIPVLLAVAVLAGCSGKITPPVTGSTYRVEALLVKKILPDSSAVFVTLKKNDAVYKGATVKIGGIILDTVSAGYVKNFTGSQFQFDSSYTLNIQDDDSLNLNLTLSLPDSFLINSPALRFFTGGAETVAWSASASADGFILATVPPDTAYADSAYKAYVATTQGEIPPETFLDGLNRIVGTHMIYVAAYIGAPIDYYGLPFRIPTVGNPADNLSMSNVSGRLAGMVLAAPDSIIVNN
jgi:hypothetical protein